MEHFDLTEKKAIVFAANSPAGKAIADAYAEAGARVERIDEIAVDHVGAAIDDAADRLDGVDILACAPDSFLAKPIAQTSLNDLSNIMMRNFTASYSACQTVLPYIRQATAGNIVLVTSVLGERGLPNTSAYSAAHGAVFNFIRAMAQELAPQGISINGIELGWMDWMHDRIDMKDENAARAVRFTLSKRAGTAEDIGPLAVWLSASAVGFVTGQIFPLDGGLTQHL